MENRVNELEKKVIVIETKLEGQENDTKYLTEVIGELKEEIHKQNKLVYWVQGGIIVFVMNEVGITKFIQGLF